MNYYPFHLGDYAAHTAHLEPMEDLAYRRMLDLYYRTERPLPSDWREIARLIRLRDEGGAIEAVLAEFFTLTDDGWRHSRCESEISRMKDKQAKARASAQVSVNVRSTNAQRTLSERSTDVELPTPTPTPTPKKDPPTPRKREGECEPVGFDRFWAVYPRKVNKPGAVRAFARLRADDSMIESIVAAVRKQAASDDWRKDDGRFVPHPATWLNGRRWEDMTEVDDDPYGLRNAL